MGWKWVLITALLGQGALAQAQDLETQRPRTGLPAPSWAETSEPMPVPSGDELGILFVRRNDVVRRLTADGEVSYINQLIRILQPRALELGNIAIAWNPAAGAASVHTLRIHRGTEVIDVLETASFEVLRREEGLETAMLDGTLTAVLKVPDLRVGDDLELAYSLASHDPTLSTTSSGFLTLQGSPPPGRYRLEISWEEGQRPQTRTTADFTPFLKETPERLVVKIDNPTTITPPRDAPPRFSWQRVVEYSDFADWQSVSRRFHALYEAASRLPAGSPLRKEAAAIAAAHTTKAEQAQAALELVQQQVRYVYVGIGGGNYLPASAEETWNRRYGDCKGKTVLLLALLASLDIKAEAVLVNNSVPTDGMDMRLPNAGLFDHVLVRARVGDKVLWLDSTLPAVIEGRAEPFFPYQWVLPLSASGSVIERLPDTPFALPQEMEIYDFDASAGFDTPAKKTITFVKRGAEGLAAYTTFSAVGADQLEANIRNGFEGNGAMDSVEKVSFRFDRETRASILTVTGTGGIEWEKEDNYTYTRLPGGGFNPPNRRLRPGGEAADVPYYQEPLYSCYVTTLRLPAATELPEWSTNSDFETMLFGRTFYRRMQIAADRTLRLVRGSRVEEREISPSKAERDNGRLDRFDNSMALLFWEKGASEDHTAEAVPASFELDWTGTGAPCLPGDLVAGKN